MTGCIDAYRSTQYMYQRNIKSHIPVDKAHSKNERQCFTIAQCHAIFIEVTLNKGNSSIPLFKTHKSMDNKQNRGNKLKLRETH